jgi:WD40 repeat protein
VVRQGRPEAGTPWSAQIAKAIQNDATAFVVYVGSGGVINWVEAEVDLALSRAATDKQNPLLFIPVLAAESAGSKALPPFAKRYHGVRDPLGDREALAKLLKAVLNAEWDASIRLIDEPFVGLRSMREEKADRFFGRDAEVKELVEKFRKHRIVAIVADSGTGKSSLAEAGFAPAFRGGALADLSRSEPDDRAWHVVSMRPGTNPEEGLRTGVIHAAEKLGWSPDEIESLRERITVADPSKTAYALKCNIRPAQSVATLLIVDQFEELLTQTPDPFAAPFARLMLALADCDKDIRVLLTVRADYFNLVSAIADGQPVRGADGKTLFERLTENGRAAILPLKRIADAGLRDAIRKPLRLAGHTDEAAQDALVKAVKRDISDQPSDLPLMQVALRAAWREHRAARIGLVEAYESVGGVLGALANEAEAARNRLSPDDQARLESIFVRLVRLGDTGGATRRTAALDEFDDARRRKLLQRLGEDEYGRLVAVREKSAEIAHEALVTQWPWLQRQLGEAADDVRRLDRLVVKSREWSEATKKEKTKYIARGAERETFTKLAKNRNNWLSKVDRDFVKASNRAIKIQRKKEKTRLENEQRAFRIARHNESVALTALANIEAEKRPINAAKLALAAWPRDPEDTVTPKLPETLDALGRIVPNLRERRVLKGHDAAVTKAAFSPDGKRIVTASYDGTARVWDAETGREIAPPLKEHYDVVLSAAFSPDGRRIVTASWDKTARLWDAETGREVAPPLKGHGGVVLSAAFSPDSQRIVTASNDTTARVWDAETGREIAPPLKGHGGTVTSAAFSPDGRRIVTASEDRTARVWDVSTIPKGNILQVACALLRMHEDPVSLDGVTDYPLTFDRPICVTDPPPPDLMAESAAPAGAENEKPSANGTAGA